MLKDIILTIVGILLPAVYSFIMFIGGIVDLLRDKDMVKAIVLIIWSLIGMIVCLVFVLVYTLNHVDDFRQRKLFKEGNKAAFDAEVRSYGSERCVPFGKENG